MEHTPGPWDIVTSQMEKHKTEIFIRGNRKKTFVGKAYGFEGQPVRQNARLIAAAPNLLSACERALKDISSNPTPETCTARIYLADAIQKAKGNVS